MGDENVLTISHQDGPQTLRLKKGGYCLENGRLAISIETDNVNADGWPPCALFCIHNYPTKSLSVGDVFECHGGMDADDADDEDAVKANAYFTFHADSVYVKFTVVERRGDEVVFAFAARHDDTDYYDARAKKCPTTGTFALKPKPREELWIPV